MEYILKQLKAHEICERRTQPTYYSVDSPRSYFVEIRDAVYRELRQTGQCTLVDQLLSGKSAHVQTYFGFNVNDPHCLPFIPFISIAQALEAVHWDKPLPIVDSTYLVWNAFSCSWSAFSYQLPNQTSLTLPPELLQELKRYYTSIKNQHRTSSGANIANRSRSANIVSPPSAVPISPESDPEAARKEAASILSAAKIERDNILLEAERQANQTRDNAERDAKQTRDNADKAKSEADEIRRSAQEEATRIKEEARAQAALEAKKEADRLIRQELAEYIRQVRQECREEQAQTAQFRSDASSHVAMLKEDACTRTTKIGADINRSLDQIQSQLNELKSGMVTELQQWRTSLYKNEYNSLVNFYNLFTSAVTRFERDATDAQVSRTTPEDALAILVQHGNTISRLGNSLNRAMEAMGLRLFTPEPGEFFDSSCHAVNDEEDDDFYLDYIIEQCTSPGIERIVNRDETAILHRATVTVRPPDFRINIRK